MSLHIILYINRISLNSVADDNSSKELMLKTLGLKVRFKYFNIASVYLVPEFSCTFATKNKHKQIYIIFVYRHRDDADKQILFIFVYVYCIKLFKYNASDTFKLSKCTVCGGDGGDAGKLMFSTCLKPGNQAEVFATFARVSQNFSPFPVYWCSPTIWQFAIMHVLLKWDIKDRPVCKGLNICYKTFNSSLLICHVKDTLWYHNKKWKKRISGKTISPV